MKEDKDQIPDEEEENNEQVSCKEITESNHANNVDKQLDPVCATNTEKAIAASVKNANKALDDLAEVHRTAILAAIKCDGPCKQKNRVCAKPRKGSIKPTGRKFTIRVVQLTDAEKEELGKDDCPHSADDWWGATATISFQMTGKCRCVRAKKKKKKKKKK